jgi:hypothetical protein
VLGDGFEQSYQIQWADRVDATLVVAGAMFRQEMEMHRLRTAIAKLSITRSEAARVISTVANPISAEIEEPRREASEVRRLRGEVAQLRREKIDLSALQTRIEELAAEVSAIPGRRSGSIAVIDGFDRPTSKASPVVAQATSLAQLSPAEAARSVATLPAGEEQNQAALAVIDRWVGSDPVAAATWAGQFAEGVIARAGCVPCRSPVGASRLEWRSRLARELADWVFERRRYRGFCDERGWPRYQACVGVGQPHGRS